jgi:hypothetical protein
MDKIDSTIADFKRLRFHRSIQVSLACSGAASLSVREIKLRQSNTRRLSATGGSGQFPPLNDGKRNDGK